MRKQNVNQEPLDSNTGHNHYAMLIHCLKATVNPFFDCLLLDLSKKCGANERKG